MKARAERQEQTRLRITESAVELHGTHGPARTRMSGGAERAELHILVPHADAARHLLGISHVAVTSEREVVVVDVEDRPGVLADLTRKIARAGVNLDLVYIATRNRVVFGATDLPALRAVLEPAS
jgi:hypothetical protein